MASRDDQEPERQPSLVLASSSPRRRLLLNMAGYDFEVAAPEIDETRFPEESPEDYVIRIAVEKARAIARNRRSGTLILGCDTTVVLGGEVLGKPLDKDHAADMLLSLAGRTHTVCTGFALVAAGGVPIEHGIDTSRVTIRTISPEEAAAYAETGEPLDKAGAYALQGRGRGFVAAVEGLRSTVIGLPLERVVDLLTRHGVLPTRTSIGSEIEGS
ncbi:MAG: nucleoside triphosphate pyrophosphatase [Acidimicrobiia bacterium]|nr:nucleoside triphosphate pyrophosphatase [Acidimicrobiia bacterium]